MLTTGGADGAAQNAGESRAADGAVRDWRRGAAWVNPRGQTGVACTPVMTGVGYEGAEPIAA